MSCIDASNIFREQMAGKRSQRIAIRSHLSRVMGERRVRIIDVARATGINRNMLARLYYDRAQRVDLADIAKLCEFLGCGLTDLFELEMQTGKRSD